MSRTMVLGYLLDHDPCRKDIVREQSCLIIKQIDLMLTASHFMVTGFDLDPELLQTIAHLAPYPECKITTQIKITDPVMGQG